MGDYLKKQYEIDEETKGTNIKFIKLTNGFKSNLYINVNTIESIWEKNNGGDVETCIRYANGNSNWVRETAKEIMEMIKAEK